MHQHPQTNRTCSLCHSDTGGYGAQGLGVNTKGRGQVLAPRNSSPLLMLLLRLLLLPKRWQLEPTQSRAQHLCGSGGNYNMLQGGWSGGNYNTL